jgi:group I intron endonuclease
MIGIYKITSPSNKIYIGKSTNIDERKKSYKYPTRRINQHKLNNSINKYGFENHLFEIIEICEETILDEREIYWISFYDSVEKGLNLMYGGQGGKQSQEVKNKKSKSMTGKKPSLETKQKMSQSKKGHPMYNDEWKEKMKEKTWISGTSSKPILQFDLNGNFIKEYISITEAKKYLNVNIKSSGITNALTGVSKTAYGYKWKYK